MSAQDLRERLIAALEEVAQDHDIDIVDVELAGPASAPIVRVRLDHTDETLPTISLEEVTEATSWVDAVVEEVDPASGAYTLEVSSPGMDRPLRRERDFVRFAGEEIALETNATEGRRRFSGKLAGVQEGSVVLVTEEGEMSFALNEIKTAKIKPDFEAHKGQKNGAAKRR